MRSTHCCHGHNDLTFQKWVTMWLIVLMLHCS